MKKIVKIFTLIIGILVLSAVLSLSIYFSVSIIKFSNLTLDLDSIKTSAISIPVLDSENNQIKDENTFKQDYISLRELPPYTYEAFISIEDKNFYNHNGISPKRIVGATLKNLKNRGFYEGASTISQQLIKNTHLSAQKTITRKLKEIVLTKKLEKTASKNEILENYLNVIYFGNNCYGISSATNYYFSKECKDLTLDESATLAGMIKAPNKYSPLKNIELCKKRRNIVLKEMLKDGKITEEQYENASRKEINLNLSTNTKNKLNSYSEMAIDEAQRLLHLPAKQIALAGYKIHTYQVRNEQEKLEKALLETFLKNDYASIVIDSHKHGVTAFVGNGNFKILETKRQPGSCIKPIFVYAPAINEDIITPETQILDEKIKISEYEPENINKKFNGYISVKESVAKSINIPAVKVLSYISIDKAKNYATKMGIAFDQKDDSYALALGGMTYGVSLKTLSDAYSTFANNGKFAPSQFVSFITDKDGNVIYKHLPIETQVLRNDTCYLMTDILKYTAKSGTAKKLAQLNIEIASKTGTVGKPNSKQNLDAWNISYTPSKVCGVWTGNLDNSPIDIAGGNEPTTVVKKFFTGAKNETFEKPNEIVYRDIDTIDLYENHKLTLANKDTPQRFKKSVMFSVFNLPNESENFLSLPQINSKSFVKDGKNYIKLETKNYIIYQLYNKQNKLIKTLSESDGEKEVLIEDDFVKIKAKYIDAKNYNEKEINF